MGTTSGCIVIHVCYDRYVLQQGLTRRDTMMPHSLHTIYINHTPEEHMCANINVLYIYVVCACEMVGELEWTDSVAQQQSTTTYVFQLLK